MNYDDEANISSKFRRKSKSPTRERSSSVSEHRPKRGSLKSSQNGEVHSGHNNHLNVTLHIFSKVYVEITI
jgi:hypothetical protein